MAKWSGVVLLSTQSNSKWSIKDKSWWASKTAVLKDLNILGLYWMGSLILILLALIFEKSLTN